MGNSHSDDGGIDVSQAAIDHDLHMAQLKWLEEQRRRERNPLPLDNNPAITGANHDRNKQFLEVVRRSIEHLVEDARALVEDEPKGSLLEELTQDIERCIGFLAHQANFLGKGGIPVQWRHLALFEAPQVAAKALIDAGKRQQGIKVLKLGLLAQKRYFGGEEGMTMEHARTLIDWGTLVVAAGDKEEGVELQKAGALWHFRLLKRDHKPFDEDLALELNGVGKRLASLGKFKDGIDCERVGREIRQSILDRVMEEAKQVDTASSGVANVAAAKIIDAKSNLAHSLHDLGVSLVKHKIEAQEGITHMREALSIRRELAFADDQAGRNVHHRQDDLAQSLKDLAQALKQLNADEEANDTLKPEVKEQRDKEASKLLHEAHVLLEKIVERERLEKDKKVNVYK